MSPGDERQFLRTLLDAAIEAALPASVVPPHLPEPPEGRTIVLGAGKASAAMARAVEEHWSGPLEGLVVTRYGHGVACKRIEIVEAAHPVPDARGEAAARGYWRLPAAPGRTICVLCLFSGGGSALLAACRRRV
jgi:glycerate 2-kinase